jgi:LacI family transcriptional regulator
VTIKDVAKAAGVSITTVSRVLNGKDEVAPETYGRVSRLIKELGYTSSLAAKGMRSRQTKVLGLITSDLNDYFCLPVMQGVSEAVQKYDYDLLIYTGGDPKRENWSERERQYVSLLNGSITDGIIVVTPFAKNLPTTYPIVTVDSQRDSKDVPSVTATNRSGALDVMRYLVGLGHRRIGHITGRLDLQSAVQRLEGYEDFLQLTGIAVDRELIALGDYSRESGLAGARRLLTLPDPPTAIFGASDEAAFGVVEAAQEMGLRIPEDLSVVGFDNSPESAYVTPSLTTVDHSIKKMGTKAVEVLMELIYGHQLEEIVHKLPTQLIIRNSCGPVGSRFERQQLGGREIFH